MLFNSYIFILLFFPLTLAGYYGFNRVGRYKVAKVFLVVMSLWFYAYFHLSYLPLILGSIMINYLLGKMIRSHLGKKKAFLASGISFNILLLFVFKYLGFTLRNINDLFDISVAIPAILMPLGISFYTFQQISYLVDASRNEVPEHSFTDYFLFVSFFPQLVAGPIVKHSEMIPQFCDGKRKVFDDEYFAKGLYRFSKGLAKKVLLADTLSHAVDYGYINVNVISGPEAWITAIMYSFQLYFDFSGYCDMACGIANCFHIDLPENFNNPYFASSISDFWKRWHITLTSFLTKYVYIPLGGNRKGKVRTYLNIMIVYLVSGIWHGADWSFVLWGMMHGVALCFYRLCGKAWDKMPEFIRVFLTFIFVSIAWVFFRAESISEALCFVKAMILPGGTHFTPAFIEKFDVLELTYIEDHVGMLRRLTESYPLINMIVILLACVTVLGLEKRNSKKEFKPCLRNAMLCTILLVWSILSLSGVSDFLYFNF